MPPVMLEAAGSAETNCWRVEELLFKPLRSVGGYRWQEHQGFLWMWYAQLTSTCVTAQDLMATPQLHNRKDSQPLMPANDTMVRRSLFLSLPPSLCLSVCLSVLLNCSAISLPFLRLSSPLLAIMTAITIAIRCRRRVAQVAASTDAPLPTFQSGKCCSACPAAPTSHQPAPPRRGTFGSPLISFEEQSWHISLSSLQATS